MSFKQTSWFRIAVVLSLINLVGGWFAARSAEPGHAAIHAVLALGFGLWAWRLRRRSGDSGSESEIESDSEARLEALGTEVSNLRQELSETEERLDFAERILARGPETRRADPQREGPKQPDMTDRRG